MTIFEQKLQTYADLIVKVGVNLQPEQRLIIRSDISSAALARLIAESAYKIGASLVDVVWTDDELTLARFKHAPRDSFEEFSAWRTDALEQTAESGGAMISISSEDPDLLAGQDPELISTVAQTAAKHMTGIREYIMRNGISWLVAAAPSAPWASKVFPEQSPQTQIDSLWNAIFSVCRLDAPDPVAAWQAHFADLVVRRNYLDAKRYSALRFTGPGTDLTVGLPENHLWMGGKSVSETGIEFAPNLPTEEIFTMPRRNRVDGVVAATKPLNFRGTLIENIVMTFENGKIVRAAADQGEAVLNKLIATDEGAAYLGEVALVAHSTPISQSGLLFFNTLFDENAASHLAFGTAYRACVEGGTKMSGDEFAAAGGNDSMIHVDFMIGGAEQNVDGIAKDGSIEPVMRAGEWVFDV